MQTYVVADVTYIPQSNQGSCYSPHVRLISVVTPPSQEIVSSFKDLSWLFFVVGSDLLTDEKRFLQVASWDGVTREGAS